MTWVARVRHLRVRIDTVKRNQFPLVTVSLSAYIRLNAVANEIEVHLASVAERTDADIAAAAVRALEWDALVPVEKLDVTVSKGWVTLRGEVEWRIRSKTPNASSDASRV